MTEPQYKKQIDEWIDSHTDEMVRDLCMLMKIESVRTHAQDGMPYGPGPAKAVKAMEGLMEAYGLRVRNYENYCVAGDLDPEKEKALDILAHLDVVPVSDTWTKTQPFEPYIEGDYIYGRGSSDDKGPAVAALYAMRAVRETGIPLKHSVRLICGSDEECGSSDLEYYYQTEKEAKYTFSPDADYPLINIEKGRLASVFTAEGEQEGVNEAAEDGFRVLAFHSGDKENVIPGRAEMTLAGGDPDILKKAAGEAGRLTGADISYSFSDGMYKIAVRGNTGHASTPQNALNALTAALKFLETIPLVQRAGEDTLMAVASMWPHGDHNGNALGVAYSDEESGELTMSLDILHYEVKNKKEDSFILSGCYDCRAPICANDENLTEKIREKLAGFGISMKEKAMSPVHYVPSDSELVRKLLESYELYFGEKGEPIAIGGGTYVHHLENGVAFGCAEPDVDNRMHGDDEFMKLSILYRSAKIFADAIIRLCG